jgi:gliding motility-associated-like protein
LKVKKYILILLLFQIQSAFPQNSRVGDGFGGRLWYRPYNYAVGSYFGYAVCDNTFQLYGWGLNSDGQLGNGNQIDSKIPVKAVGMTNLRFFTCGYFMAVIKRDNTGWIWGGNSYVPSLSPNEILDNVKFASAGEHSVSFVRYDGTVWSVGRNEYGEFGNGTSSQTFSLSTEKMNNITSAVRVANGGLIIAALLSDGSVMSCGSNYYGGLGNNSPRTTSTTTPVKAEGLKGIIDIKANAYAVIALDSSGDVYQWGSRNYFGLNLDFIPRKVTQLKNIVAISGKDDGFHFLALDSNKNCYGWGGIANYFGGDSNDGIDTPILVATDVVDIMAGELFSYIIKTDGSLWASGSGITPIWMNLKDTLRGVFTKLEPMDSPMYLCHAIPYRQLAQYNDTISICSGDSVNIKGKYYKPNSVFIDSIFGGTSLVDTFKTTTIIAAGYLHHQNKTIYEGDTLKIGPHKYFTSGVFRDTVLNNGGCDTLLVTNLKVIPVTRLTRFIKICGGDTFKLSGHNYFKTGVYLDTLINNAGYDSIITTDLAVIPTTSFTQNVQLCAGDTLKIAGHRYYASGIYKDIFTNYAGCDSVISTHLKVFPALKFYQTAEICIGDSFKVGSHSYFASGTYSDTFKNNNECDSIVTTHLKVIEHPIIVMSQDTILCEDDKDTLILDAGVHANYLWQPSGDTTRQIKIFKAGLYHVTVSNSSNCYTTGSVQVHNLCKPWIFVPNVFSPNGDRVNDSFKPVSEFIFEFEMVIYNRWGQEIFRTNAINSGWDGTYQGKEAAQDAYIYSIEAKGSFNKTFHEKGTFILIR